MVNPDDNLDPDGFEALVEKMISILNSPILTLLAIPYREIQDEEDTIQRGTFKTEKDNFSIDDIDTVLDDDENIPKQESFIIYQDDNTGKSKKKIP